MIRKSTIAILPLASCFLLLISTCRKDKGKIDYTPSGYPQDVGEIIVGKCATPGCHTKQSKDGAAGISLETWEDLFEGGKSGACCIPYRHDYSTLFLFTNTDPAMGAVNEPTMPLNKPPLTKDEMKILTDWINAGAPNSEGKIAFADNPNRKKIYITNQGCDVVAVIDAATQLQMRYIDVGASAQIESPHMIKISPDGKYWYSVFSNSGNVMQKFNASDDSPAGEVFLGTGSWNTFTISNDSKYGFAVDWKADGRVAYVDLDAMSLMNPNPIWAGSGLFPDAHGSAINAKGDTLYLTSQSGSFIMKAPVSDPGSVDTVNLTPTSFPSPALMGHEISFSPDSLYYYVTCQNTNEVRVKRVSDDMLIKTITTGTYPLEMAFSKTKPYLFVTCEYDLTPPETNRGSVTVIDYTTNTVVKNLRLNMAEPHGIAVDDANGLVYVANRNITGASVPHHSTNCGGTNGFISFIDLNTLTVIPDKKIEVAVDPYSIAVR